MMIFSARTSSSVSASIFLSSASCLREGQVALDIGVLGETGGEIRVQSLLRDAFVGVTASDHALSSGGPVTAERYAGERHFSVSRRGVSRGPIDDALRSFALI